MKIIATNNKLANSKPNFKGNLIGKLPEELNKYSKEFGTYAKESLASLPSDVVLTEGMSSKGKFLNATAEFPHCYCQTPIMVSSVKSFDDLKNYVNSIKNEVNELISANKKCGFIK